MQAGKLHLPQALGHWLNRRWYHPLWLSSIAIFVPILSWLVSGVIWPTWWLAWLVLGFCVRQWGWRRQSYLLCVFTLALVIAVGIGIPLIGVTLQAVVLLSVLLLSEGRYRGYSWALLLELWTLATVVLLSLALSIVGSEGVSWFALQMQEQMHLLLTSLQGRLEPGVDIALVRHLLAIYLMGGLIFDVFLSSMLLSLFAEAWYEVVEKRYQGIAHRIASIKVSRSVLILTAVLITMMLALDKPEHYSRLIPSLMVLCLPYVVAGYGVLYQKVHPKPGHQRKVGSLCFHLGVVLAFPLSAMILGIVGLLDCVVHFRQGCPVKHER